MQFPSPEEETAPPGGDGSRTTGKSSERCISFAIGGRRCAVLAAAVAEVTLPLRPAAIPNSPSWLLGLAPYRGDVMAVMDPAAASPQGRANSDGRRARLIVFRNSGDRIQLSLPVDQIFEMVHVEVPHHRRGPDVVISDVDSDAGQVDWIDHDALFSSLTPHS
jgi:chemotaxis signal transduction protein